jgi:glycosyltransferase involved in cell wall biosynthesis
MRHNPSVTSSPELRQHAPVFDRMIIDDGSQDETFALLNNMGEKVSRLPSNLGYGRALQTGMRYALQHNYDVVVTLDADGQHRPQDVARDGASPNRPTELIW